MEKRFLSAFLVLLLKMCNDTYSYGRQPERGENYEHQLRILQNLLLCGNL